MGGHFYGNSSEATGQRSFEDIPASQYRVRSRRAFFEFDCFSRNLALSVLKDSYKGMDMGSGNVTPQMKKLQRSFTFPEKLEDFKEAVRNSVEYLNDAGGRTPRVESPSSSKSIEFGSNSGLQRMKKLHKNLSVRNAASHLRKHKSTDDGDYLEIRTPFCRSINGYQSWRKQQTLQKYAAEKSRCD